MSKNTQLNPTAQWYGSKMTEILRRKYSLNAFIDEYRSAKFMVTIGVDSHRYSVPFITQDRIYYKVDKKGTKVTNSCYVDNIKAFISIVRGQEIPFKDLGTTKSI